LQALLLATGEDRKLTPLGERIPSPMVTILNRPVMVYNLELLGQLGFKRVLVSVHSLAHRIEEYFGDGQRWGVSLEYILQRDALGSAGALRWAKRLLTDHIIVMPADQIADLDLSQALHQHTSQGATATVVVQPGARQARPSLQLKDEQGRVRGPGSGLTDSLTDTGIYIFDPSVLECIPPRQPFGIRQHLLPLLLAKGIQVQICPLDGYWNPLDSFQNYMEAQKVFLSGVVKANSGSERKASYRYSSVESRQISQGVWSGKNVRIHPNAKIIPLVSIGRNSWIGRDVELGPDVVIGSGVVIDQGATVKNSIILDNTYVGKLVHLENRLVNQDQLVDLDTNESVRITDPVMLGKINPQLTLSGFQRPLDLCMALLFLFLTLPLLLCLGILLKLTTGQVFKRVTCNSPRILPRKGSLGQMKTFDLLHFNTRKKDGRSFRIGTWLERWEGQRLPELLNVIKGDLALVGLKPIVTEAEKEIRKAWRLEADRAQAGFTGQWYLHTNEHSPLEDSLIADVYYLATRSSRQDWRILRGTPAAWLWKARSRLENEPGMIDQPEKLT
jgi:NDP-sugar pyrophosphorylase family protein/lipopolysaccharide/colanic/teichoic acid biosynthesis glycosyltransferase